MTTQPHLDSVIAQILATGRRTDFDPNPALKISLPQLSELFGLLPHFDSIWIASLEDSKTVWEYSRIYHRLDAMSKGKQEQLFYYDLYLIERVSAFSREGVERNYELDILLLRGLAGERVDLSKFDRRQIIFHEQQLLAGGLANGSWSNNGSYTCDFKLKSLTEKGSEFLSNSRRGAELLTIKPSIWGLSIDLKELIRRVRGFLDGKK